jgi:hypothetical protein
MALCPDCKTPGAYIGLNSVECRNPKCKYFRLDPKKTCGCCGIIGHEASVCPGGEDEAMPDGPKKDGTAGKEMGFRPTV